MDFKQNEQQALIENAVRSFILKEFPEDHIKELSLEKKYPIELDRKMAELGFFGICFPEQYGGSGFGATSVAIVIEEVSRYALDLGLSYGLNVFGGLSILNFGTEVQKNTYLPKMINGEISFSAGYYEPFSFTDMTKIKGNILEQGGKVVMRESVIFSEKRSPNKNFILLPLVLKDRAVVAIVPQVTLGEGEVLNTLGMNLLGMVKHIIKGIGLEKAQLIDGEGNVLGFMANLLKFINTMSCIGNMRHVVSQTIEYSKKRVQFGSPIGTFQSLQHLIVDAKIKADVSKLFGNWIAWLIENNNKIESIEKEVNMANCYVTQAFMEVVNTGMQVMGGYGYIIDNNMERYTRDARMTTYFVEDAFLQKKLIAKYVADEKNQ